MGVATVNPDVQYIGSCTQPMNIKVHASVSKPMNIFVGTDEFKITDK
jgi:hypothetical protein